MTESLSVIIPAYQAEKYLKEAVASVRQQNWPGTVEILVIDDGSTDGTAAEAEGLDVVLLRKSRGGAASARNMGLKSACGDLIFFLDADDVLCERSLITLYEAMKSNHADVVFSMAEDFISEELNPVQRAALRPREGSYSGVLPGCSLIRRKVFEEIGIFDETMKSGETVAWLMKLRDNKLPTVQISMVTLKRRLHLTNTGRMNQKQEMANYAALLRARMKKT